MAGFFSLGGSSSAATNNNNNNPPQDPNNEINPESFYLYHPNPTTRNQELTHNYPYNKGTFDLWQNPPPPPPPQHHQRQNPLMLQDFYSVAVGSTNQGGGSGMNIYDQHSRSGVVVAGGGGGGGFMVMGSSSTTSSGSGTISCQDCGNQAKKDCVHRRCRSCCKSQGFECTTHVKSTWVPAAKRRERQQHQQQHEQITTNTSSSRDNHPQQIPKRIRDNKSSFPSASNPSASGMELGNLPAEVNTTAVFRCVRVSSIDNTEDQFAYQTAVNIGGHTFKGILYDQGPDMTGDASPGGSRNISQLNLTTAAATSTSTSSPGTTPSASQFLDSYQSGPHFMAGMQFFHQHNPRS